MIGDQTIELASPDFSAESDDKMLVKSCFTNLLTPKEGQVLYLHYIMDYPIADIAAILDVSRQAVNQEKNRAIKKIQEKFDNHVYN